jgi:tetratricopeptide (TPR) repeat protein
MPFGRPTCNARPLDPRSGARTLEAFFARPEVEPSREARALLGHAYYLLEQYAEARAELELATRAMQSPPEPWLQVLLATCYEQKDFARAQQVLRGLAARFPDLRRYWVELSTIALYLEDEPLALASLELAEDAGLLEASDLVQLVRLNLHLDAPARAARLLETALADRRVVTNAAHLELLGDAWVMAREYQRAADALSKAATLAPERRSALALREGELYVHLERWERAMSVLDVAAKSSDARIAAQANLLVGVAAYYQGEYARGLVAFGRAEAEETTRSEALQWSKHTIRRIE